MDQFDYARSDRLTPSLDRYIKQYIPVGGFPTAALSNDLKEAVGRADSTNLRILPIIVAWLSNEAPCGCRGTPQRVKEWIALQEVPA